MECHLMRSQIRKIKCPLQLMIETSSKDEKDDDKPKKVCTCVRACVCIRVCALVMCTYDSI